MNAVRICRCSSTSISYLLFNEPTNATGTDLNTNDRAARTFLHTLSIKWSKSTCGTMVWTRLWTNTLALSPRTLEPLTQFHNMTTSLSMRTPARHLQKSSSRTAETLRRSTTRVKHRKLPGESRPDPYHTHRSNIPTAATTQQRRCLPRQWIWNFLPVTPRPTLT
jgi:hypothetical protein